MGSQRFINAMFFAEDGRFHPGGFSIEDGLFRNVGETDSGEDLSGAYVIPGLLDIHTHGNSGFDFSNCSEAELAAIARAHAAAGIAGFCPTSMTLPETQLANAFSNAAALHKNPPPSGADILGINMEGPYISKERKGAQNPKYLTDPNEPMFRRLQQIAGGLIKIVDIAPELPGSFSFIEALKGEIVLSLAHSNADYETARKAFDAGIAHVTHLFNAMPGLNHREPGPIAAAAESPDVTVELIADGNHIHPSIIRLCFSLFGAERICLVSDSMEATGLSDGTYQLGGQSVLVKGNRAELEDATIAGSVTPLYHCIKNAIDWGIPKESAVIAAALTPAKRLGLEGSYGSITDRKRASFIVADSDFNIKQIYLRGTPIYG